MNGHLGCNLKCEHTVGQLADEDEGWARLARNLKAEMDTERIKAYRGTVSLLFEAGQQMQVAVKIVDDRGIESLKVVEVV